MNPIKHWLALTDAQRKGLFFAANCITCCLLLFALAMTFFTWRVNEKTRDLIEETKSINEANECLMESNEPQLEAIRESLHSSR